MFAAILHFRRGNLAAAIENSAAKARFEAEGDAKGEVDALIALANAKLQAGNRDGALVNFNRAAALCTENKYELGFAQLYADLGLLLQSLGKTKEAEQIVIKSLALADRLGETAIAALAAGNLSLLYRETQDLDRAEQMARQALRLEGQLERKDGVARATLNLGTILFERGNLDEAAARFAESLRLYEGLGPPERAAQAMFNLGNVHRAGKRTNEAETHYRKAVDLFLSVNDAGGVAAASGNLGTLYLEAGRLAEAQAEFNTALDAAREADDKRRHRHADAQSRRARPCPRRDGRGLRGPAALARALHGNRRPHRGGRAQGAHGPDRLRPGLTPLSKKPSRGLPRLGFCQSLKA